MPTGCDTSVVTSSDIVWMHAIVTKLYDIPQSWKRSQKFEATCDPKYFKSRNKIKNSEVVLNVIVMNRRVEVNR